MTYLKPEDSHVLLCDWEGRLNWSSKAAFYEAYGDLAWNYVSPDDRDVYRGLFSRVATLKEEHHLDVDCIYGGRYRAWMWPLQWPGTAVCVLAMRIPEEMRRLTARELECLQHLSSGLTVGQLALALDVSNSTVHTLLRRARIKLKLRNIEELLSFSARYCYPRRGLAAAALVRGRESSSSKPAEVES